MSAPPATWSLVKLGEISEFKYGKALPATVRDGGEFPVYGSNGIVGQHSTWLSVGPTIIIGRKGSVGEVCFSDKNCSPIDTTYYVDSFEFLEPKFYFYLLKTLRLGHLNKSTAIPGLNRQDAYDLEIGLPPLAEQTRIAAKLDELLAQVDTLKTRIDSIPALLKRFRQSVLAYAVSGQLTEEWRSSNKLASPIVSKFEDLLKDRGKLSYGVLKPGDADPEGVPMVRVMDIGEWGKIDRAEIFKISKALSEEYKRTVLEKGDILLSVMATIGRAAIVPESLVGGNVNRALAVIKLGNVVSAEFAFFQIMSPQFQLEFVEKQLGSAQRRINLSDLREFTVLVPAREEQTEIVRRVEQLFAFADQLETRVKVAQARINHLTQSILDKAFRGELVAQEPTDEPASVLLERIKAQRITVPKAKRGRRAATLD
ncbi:restriction endonuclease subunit S [Pseudomonas sp. B26140]|uniref:restriction endonuclease subunit S n=1 Tax=Pseudomonas sp. B26140 TaxID=3235112 RepID=UPI003784B17A